MTQLPMVRTIFRVPASVSCVAQIAISLFGSNTSMGGYEWSVAAHWESMIRGLKFKNNCRHTSASMPHMLNMLRFKYWPFFRTSSSYVQRYSSHGPVSNQTLATDEIGIPIDNITADTDD